jgi:hypothetical protein
MRFMRLGVIAIMFSLVSCGNSPSITESTDGGFSIDTTQIDPSGQGEGVLSESDAGRLYLEIVNSVDCAYWEIVDIQNDNSLGDGTVDPAALFELQTMFGVLASARESAVRSFLDNSWPEVVAADIETIARVWSKAARAEFAISVAIDQSTYTLAMNSYNVLISESDANPGYIRSALGIGPASETDQC